jgi:hypothetical protein
LYLSSILVKVPAITPKYKGSTHIIFRGQGIEQSLETTRNGEINAT